MNKEEPTVSVGNNTIEVSMMIDGERKRKRYSGYTKEEAVSAVKEEFMSDLKKMAKVKKTSCCCGATKSNPCACMKKGVMKCSSKEPKCPCYKVKDLKKSFDIAWSVIKRAD